MGQGSGRAHRLTCAERLELQRRVRAGETHEVAATAVGCSAKSVQRLLVKTGGVKPRSTPRSALRLSLPEREEISRGLLAGDACRVIARRLGRSPSTVSRDVAAAGHRERYRAWRADETAHRRAHRPKIREADGRAAASARSGAGAATAVVPAANHRTAGPRLSRRFRDACVARD